MKKSVFISLLFCLVMINSLNAQIIPGYELNVGGIISVPVGDFSSENTGASVGFGAFLDGRKMLNDYTGWYSTIAYNQNSVPDIVMSDESWNISTSDFEQYWFMTGVGVETNLTPLVRVYANGQLGLLYSVLPAVSVTVNGVSAGGDSESTGSFGYGLSAGIKIGRVNLGVKYFLSDPEYDAPENNSSADKIEVPVSVMNLSIGIIF